MNWSTRAAYVLATSLACLWLAGCTVPSDDAAEGGNLVLELRARGSDRTLYGLDGTLTIDGAEDFTLDISHEERTLRLDLPPGSYEVTLRDYQVYVVDGGDATEEPLAVLTSANPVVIEVPEDGVAELTFIFAVPGGEVTFENGTLDVQLEVVYGLPDGAACEADVDCESGLCIFEACVASGWAAPEQITQGPDATIGGWGAGMDEAGNVVALWIHQEDGIGRLHSRRFSVHGGWGPELQIDSSAGLTVHSPAISVASNGTAAAAWLESDGERKSVWMSRFDPVEGWEPPELVYDASNVVGHLRVVTDSLGNTALAWSAPFFDGLSQVSIWGARYQPGYGFVTHHFGDYDFRYVELAMDDDGNAALVWTTTTSPSPSNGEWPRVMASTSSAGRGWAPVEVISLPTETTQAMNTSPPKVMFDSDGNARAIWSSLDVFEVVNGYSLRAYRVMVSRYSPEAGWGMATPVSPLGESVYARAVAMNSQQDMALFWADGVEARVARIDETTGWEGDESISFAPALSSGCLYRASCPIAFDNTDAAHAIWRSADGVWVNRMTPEGQWGIASRVLAADFGNYVVGSEMVMSSAGTTVAIWSVRYESLQASVLR